MTQHDDEFTLLAALLYFALGVSVAGGWVLLMGWVG